MDDALEYAEFNSPVDLKKLSGEGRVLVDDTRDLLETLRIIIAEKNADELIQNAIWASYAGDPSRAKQDGAAPITKAEASKDVDQAAAHVRVLITLFVTNSEFRKILQDLGFIGRDLFATGATKAAEQVAKTADKARPSQEQLDQVDQPAPSKEWVGANGARHGPNETPQVQVKGPGGREMVYDPKTHPREAQMLDADGNTHAAGDVYNEAQARRAEAQEAKENYKGQAKDQASSHLSDVNAARDPNASLGTQKEQLKSAAASKGEYAQSQAQGQSGIQSQDQGADAARAKGKELYNRIPEEHRARATDAFNDARQTLSEALPEERRQQFIYRLKKVVVECQEHRDYSEAMTWLLETLENYTGHAKHVGGKGGAAVGEVKSDPGISQAVNGFRTLLERFANGKSVNGMISALDNIYQDAQNDPELRNYFTRVNDYVHRALLEPGFILEPESDQEANQLIDAGRSFFSDRYRGHQKHLADEIELWFTAMAADPLNQRLGDDVKRLTKDLLFDAEGNLTFKNELWNDIRVHFLPAVISRVGYIPIPRAEYSDDKIDLAVENLTLSGPNLFPNIVELESHNLFRFSPYPQVQRGLASGQHVFRLKLDQIQADIRDVHFAFRRKSGWPRIRDSGIADVVLAGHGISVDAEIETTPNNRNRVYKVNHVKVHVGTLKFSIRNSKHDLLYKFIKTVATGIIKKAIQVGIASAIKSALEEGHEQLLQVRNTADDAKHREGVTRQDAVKDLYARKKADKEAEKAKKEPSSGEFKIVTSREDVINPDLLPNAQASKAFKTEDLAGSGVEWRSPAFDLFDPKHPAVTGKQHPEAVEGAGRKDYNSSALAAARSGQGAGAPVAAGTATGHHAGQQVVGTVPVITEVPVIQNAATGAQTLATQGTQGLTSGAQGVASGAQGLTSGVPIVGQAAGANTGAATTATKL